MKNDARVRYTKRVLREALLRLLAEKPINRITVKEVCDAAQVNRATFYAHYSDCFDLLQQTENDLLEDFKASLGYIDGLSVERLIDAIYDMIERNIALCDVLIFGSTDSKLLAEMIALSHDGSIAMWRAHLPRASEAQLEMLFICLSRGLMNVVRECYRKYSRSEVISFVNQTVRHCLSPYI